VQPQREASAAKHSSIVFFFGFIFMKMMRRRPLQH
jgi:hypothetical protein